MSSRDNELLDNDPTDELPILVETAVLDPEMVTAAVAQSDFVSVDDATGEHTVRYPIIPDISDESADIDALKSDLEASTAKIEALEMDIRRLSARWLDVDQRLTEKEAIIERLTATLATTKQALDSEVAASQGLSMELADRESQLKRVLDELDAQRQQNAALQLELDGQREQNAAQQLELDRQRQQNAALQLELDRQRQHAKGFETELAVVREQLAERLARPPAPAPDQLQALQEEVATLTGYIANRRSHWGELEATTAVTAARIGELERELDHRTARQQAAEELAHNESARAESFRRELVKVSRAVEARADRDAASNRQTATPVGAPSLDPSPSGSFEVVAQLEAELERNRTQFDKHAEDLRAKDRQLELAAAELDQVRRQLAEARAQLEQDHTDVGRLERVLVDKDRSLDARNERIAALQEELDQKLGALQKLNAMDLSLKGLDSQMSDRLKTDPTEQTRNTPALVCVTSDAPRHYALNKSTMTIGRSSECDIQIFTHFVSREHAKVTVDRSRVVIEDLGSTNGVFVNSVRIDRRELQHSDLVTVGETQFRFLERMAH